MMSDDTLYLQYRGKCKELSQAYVDAHPEWRLVRGYYYCPIWGQQAHWWCKNADGTIHDPTKAQFPSGGLGLYEEFDGMTTCEMCGKRQPEARTVFGGNGNHTYCSGNCYMKAVL